MNHRLISFQQLAIFRFPYLAINADSPSWEVEGLPDIVVGIVSLLFIAIQILFSGKLLANSEISSLALGMTVGCNIWLIIVYIQASALLIYFIRRIRKWFTNPLYIIFFTIAIFMMFFGIFIAVQGADAYSEAIQNYNNGYEQFPEGSRRTNQEAGGELQKSEFLLLSSMLIVIPRGFIFLHVGSAILHICVFFISVDESIESLLIINSLVMSTIVLNSVFFIIRYLVPYYISLNFLVNST